MRAPAVNSRSSGMSVDASRSACSISRTSGGTSVTIDAEYVDKHLGELVKDEDLTRYIL